MVDRLIGMMVELKVLQLDIEKVDQLVPSRVGTKMAFLLAGDSVGKMIANVGW